MIYLVMECHPAYAIVLDQAGRMIKVANMGYEAGQKVDHVIARRTQTVPLRFRLAPLMIAACLCAAILGGRNLWSLLYDLWNRGTQDQSGRDDVGQLYGPGGWPGGTE